MIEGFDQARALLLKVERELDGKAARRRLRVVGQKAAKEIIAAVRRTPSVMSGHTLADGGMSGFGNTPIIGYAKVISDHEVEVAPKGKVVGQMAILERGRKQYAAGDTRVKSTYKSKKTGELRIYRRKVKRATTAAGGKGTWSDAVSQMSQQMPADYEVELVKDLSKFLKRG